MNFQEFLAHYGSKGYEEEVKEFLPSGSGFDADIVIQHSEVKLSVRVQEASGPFKFMSTKEAFRGHTTLRVPFHHLSEEGYYCGWTLTTFLITASEIIPLHVDQSELDDEHFDSSYHLNYILDELIYTIGRAPCFKWDHLDRRFKPTRKK